MALNGLSIYDYKVIKSVYQHLIISFILLLTYLSITIILINELNSLFFLITVLLLFLLINLIWSAYQTNRFISIIFIFFVLILLYSNLNDSSLKEKQSDLKYLFEISTSVKSNDIGGSGSINQQATTSYESILYYLKDKNKIIYNKNDNKLSNLTISSTSSSYNIFFVETNIDSISMTTKQMCAIESAAFHNPSANVYILSIRALVDRQYLRLFQIYTNIIWMKLVPSELFLDTPLMKWWQSGHLTQSKFMTAHLSDAVRLALLWKYGGFYSDLDTITIKSFQTLNGINGAGFLNGKMPSLANGFLHFNARHPFIQMVMINFASDYQPNIWGHNGPILLRRCMKLFCSVNDIYSSLILSDKNKNNCSINIYPQEYFYPYNNYQLDFLFKNELLNITRLKTTYSVHFYGKVSSIFSVNARHDNNVYSHFASSHCEFIFNDLKSNNKSFT
jgi:lactosylceramide 4-alpha-galactosyltransferase